MPTDTAEALLQAYAECHEPERAEALLAELLVNYAQPAIRKIVRYKLAFQGASESQDIDDVASDVVVELIARLRALREAPEAAGIGAFSGYAAVAAYHACNEYLRRKYPNRHRLKSRLRYLLGTEKSFAIWEDPATGWMCGLSAWQFGEVGRAAHDRIRRWEEILAEVPRGRRATHPADLLHAIFERFGGPLAFDDLVGMVAELWGVEDPPVLAEAKAREVESPESDPSVRMELERWLVELWHEIGELPRAQRCALLLNLRAGPNGPAVALLPLTGVASIREIARVLEFTIEKFTELWNSMPLEDLAIAELLGVTRQQVINLRKSARQRLTRRTGGNYRLP